MGCVGSKTTGAAEPAISSVAVGSSSGIHGSHDERDSSRTILHSAAEPKPQGSDPDEKLPALNLSVLSAEGLRPVTGIFVEAEVAGQPGSRVKTAIVQACKKSQYYGEETRETSEADLRSDLTLKPYPEGSAVTLTVMDCDPLQMEPLGRVTVPAMMIESQFWGKVPLSDAGEGFEAHLELRFGDRHILVETAQEITDVMADAVADLKEVVVEAKGDLTETLKKASKEAQQGLAHGSIPEVKEAVSHGVMESEEIGKETWWATQAIAKDGAGEVVDVVEDAVEEVKETQGVVCCQC